MTKTIDSFGALVVHALEANDLMPYDLINYLQHEYNLILITIDENDICDTWPLKRPITDDELRDCIIHVVLDSMSGKIQHDKATLTCSLMDFIIDNKIM